jgi:spore germination cell wall hydrolase CwlJ-like protein
LRYAPWRAGKPDATTRNRTLTFWDPTDELPPREFAARVTRRARSHDLTRPVHTRLLRRRLGVLALAVAVPAVAAPVVRDVAPPAVVEAPVATYAAPLDPEFAAWQPAAGAPAVSLATAAMPADLTLAPAPEKASTSPAARAFYLGGSFTDRLRAEECLTMAIYYEAASETTAGQQAVAQVVMNRLRHPSYPNTVCGVVFQGSQRSTGCQFSFTCDGSLARKPQAAAWNRARRVASAALGGFVFAPVGLATHYHTTAIYPYWAPSLTVVGTIGAHRFYRWSGMAGTSTAFTSAYAGSEPLPVRNSSGGTAPLAGELGVQVAPVMAMPPLTGADSSGLSPASAAPVATAAPATASPPMQSQLFPQSGAVREEYAGSGAWLRQP